MPSELRAQQAVELINSLVHDGDYDPQKRREYYLRTRELKGRQPVDQKVSPRAKAQARFYPSNRPAGRVSKGVVTKNNASERQAEIKARVGRLRGRLEKLNAKLKEIRSRSQKKDEPSSKSNTSSGSKEDRKPLTASQKRAKAKDDKERYEEEKEKLPTTEKEIVAEIRNVESKLKAILSEARNNST